MNPLLVREHDLETNELIDLSHERLFHPKSAETSLDAAGKPSTWFLPGDLGELSGSRTVLSMAMRLRFSLV